MSCPRFNSRAYRSCAAKPGQLSAKSSHLDSQQSIHDQLFLLIDNVGIVLLAPDEGGIDFLDVERRLPVPRIVRLLHSSSRSQLCH